MTDVIRWIENWLELSQVRWIRERMYSSWLAFILCLHQCSVKKIVTEIFSLETIERSSKWPVRGTNRQQNWHHASQFIGDYRFDAHWQNATTAKIWVCVCGHTTSWGFDLITFICGFAAAAILPSTFMYLITRKKCWWTGSTEKISANC